MKIQHLILFFVLLTTIKLAAYGQNSPYLFDFYENGKVGFMDSTGRTIIAPRFDATRGFEQGRAGVEIGNKWGFIDTKGNIVVQPQFDGVADYQDSMVLVWNNTDEDWDNSIYGFVDWQGRIVRKPQFGMAHDFHDGLASVNVGDYENPLWGFIDRTGRMVIDAQYPEGSRFGQGLASVRDKSGKEGFIDRTGRMVIPPKYDGAGYFCHGLALVRIGTDTSARYGFIDTMGRYVVQPKYGYAFNFDEKGYAHVKTSAYLHLQAYKRPQDLGKRGIIDPQGNEVVPAIFESASMPSEGLAAVQSGRKWGYVNLNRQYVVEPQYD